MIGWILFLVFIEYYSVGAAILAKKSGKNNWLLNLIPFAAFFYIEKYLPEGFKILTVPVKKWGKLTIILTAVCLAAYLYGLWGQSYFTVADNREALTMILWLPAGACIAIFWLGAAASAAAVLNKNNATFRCCSLVCLTLLPIPFLLAGAQKEKSKRENVSA